MHMKTHLPGGVPKKHKCDQCDFSSAFVRDLERHKTAKHGTRELKFSCDKCHFKTTTVFYLKSHKERGCRETMKKFKCDLCDYTARSNTILKCHLRSHNHSNGPFIKVQCPECSEMFRPNSLEGHRARAHGKIPESKKEYYKPSCCTVCGKKYRNHYDMAKHRSQYHNRSILYECTICEMSFKEKGNLIKHEKAGYHLQRLYDQLECLNCIEVTQNFIVDTVTAIHHELEAIEILKTRLQTFNK